MVLIILLFFSASLYAEIPVNIVINPNGSTPLSAIVDIGETNTEPITVFVRGKSQSRTISYTYPANFGSKLPVHGFYSGVNNMLVVKPKSSAQQVYRVYVSNVNIVSRGTPIPGAEPDAGQPIRVRTRVMVDALSSPHIQNQDLFFVSMPNAGVVVGFDRFGDMRYVYQPSQGKPYLIRMHHVNNHITMEIIDHNQYYQRTDMLGRNLFRYRLGVHHDAVPYKNGRTIALANSRWGWEDAVIIINARGKIERQLSIGDAIRKVISPEDRPILQKIIYDERNIYKAPSGKNARMDWAHANSLVYDADKDLLYLSLRHQGVLAVKVDTWTLEWFLTDDNLEIMRSDTPKYGEILTDALFLKDVPSLQQFRLRPTFGGGPIGQHALFLRQNGNLLMFDNQADKKDNDLGSRVMEYRIIPRDGLAQVVIRYQTIERNYSRFMSDVDVSGDFYENILILFSYGKVRRIIELNVGLNPLFDMWIDTPSSIYRVDKFPVYPYSDPNRKYTLDYIHK